jgi:hypothetical protein
VEWLETVNLNDLADDGTEREEHGSLRSSRLMHRNEHEVCVICEVYLNRPKDDSWENGEAVNC